MTHMRPGLASSLRATACEPPLLWSLLTIDVVAVRTSVSMAAATLQSAGMISYTRGNVTLLDVEQLETAACECYQIIKDQALRWSAEKV
jgi:hypothetical protein